MSKVRHEGRATVETNYRKGEAENQTKPKVALQKFLKRKKAWVKKKKLFGPLHIHFSCLDVNTLILKPDLGLTSLQSGTWGHSALCMWTEHLFFTLSYSFCANTASSQQSGSPEGPLLSAKFNAGSMMRDLLVEKSMGRVALFILSSRRPAPLAPHEESAGFSLAWHHL